MQERAEPKTKEVGTRECRTVCRKRAGVEGEPPRKRKLRKGFVVSLSCIVLKVRRNLHGTAVREFRDVP